MQFATDAEGCTALCADLDFPAEQIGATFSWGVSVSDSSGTVAWAIPTEIADPNATDRYRQFVLGATGQTEEYWLCGARRFGAQKLFGSQAGPGIRFSVWAPYAQSVEVVFAPAVSAGGNGYIDDGGDGIDASAPVIPLTLQSGGIWSSDAAQTLALLRFDTFFERLYMYRIVNEQGATTYKTDLWSRNQIGRGPTNPGGQPYAGSYANLDGTVSCSVVSDPDLVTAKFEDTGPHKESLVPADAFWATEFSAAHPLPQALRDLIIYELHVGCLGFASTAAGTLGDAMAFLDALVELGVNAVELLPILEFDGDLQWGYGTSHFFSVQTSAGGGNQLKHFIRAAHQRGIAVILDVVYNHFLTSDGERSEWGYASDPEQAPQHNQYYWYEGMPSDYASLTDGYVDNGSSGWAPRLWEENVRQMFTSSALMLVDEYHADGLRVDLTDALHQSNDLHGNGQPLGNVNACGTKFLRELINTVRLVRPGAFLIAEDHTGWPAMTQPASNGGVGFDAVWYADFYHHLIGDGAYGPSYARLLYAAGFGNNDPLAMDYFAAALGASRNAKIVYHECHDTAGNEYLSERTIVTAANAAPLIGATRDCAEARSRFCFGMAALSAGTPMFLMGEEIGAAKPFRYNDFNLNKEDLIGDRTGVGAGTFAFYQDLIALVLGHSSLRCDLLEIAYTHDGNRVIAIYRSDATEDVLVTGSLNDNAFTDGYTLSLTGAAASGTWKEIFNSDALRYGGANVGNQGGSRSVVAGTLNVILPARGFIVFTRTS
jgi:1,4-alpha-glucan branching enzyme